MTGFWIFMFLFNMMIPLTMAGFGHLFAKQAPGQINSLFGYRTSRSMKNKDTWQFAHAHIGKTWKMLGLVSLVLTALVMLFLFGKETDLVGRIGGIISGVQVFIMIASIFPTESALKQTFDKNGKRKI